MSLSYQKVPRVSLAIENQCSHDGVVPSVTKPSPPQQQQRIQQQHTLVPRHSSSLVLWSLGSKVPHRMSKNIRTAEQLFHKVQQTFVWPDITKCLSTKPHRLYMQGRFLANAGSPGDAMQPHVVCRFNGLHLCIPCKFMDYYSFADPGGMKGWVELVGWPTADSLPTKWSSVNHGSGAGQGKSAGQGPTS